MTHIRKINSQTPEFFGPILEKYANKNKILKNPNFNEK